MRRLYVTVKQAGHEIADSLKKTAKDIGMDRSLRHGVEGMSPKMIQEVQEQYRIAPT